jgi:hypothetical protein
MCDFPSSQEHVVGLHAATQRVRAANLEGAKAAVRAKSIGPSARPRPSKKSSTVWTRRSSSSARSTSRRTTATPRDCARNSRSRGSTGHSGQLEELDVEYILAFAERVLPRAADSGCRPHSTSASGSNSCSFPTESRLTETALFEPPQPHRPSATCGRLRTGMKGWWT